MEKLESPTSASISEYVPIIQLPNILFTISSPICYQLPRTDKYVEAVEDHFQIDEPQGIHAKAIEISYIGCGTSANESDSQSCVTCYDSQISISPYDHISTGLQEVSLLEFAKDR